MNSYDISPFYLFREDFRYLDVVKEGFDFLLESKISFSKNGLILRRDGVSLDNVSRLQTFEIVSTENNNFFVVHIEDIVNVKNLKMVINKDKEYREACLLIKQCLLSHISYHRKIEDNCFVEHFFMIPDIAGAVVRYTNGEYRTLVLMK